MGGAVETDGGGRAWSSAVRLRADREVQAIEREYRDHRGAVLAMLGAQFPRLADPEEQYPDPWAELLELERSGERVRHRSALLKTIARRRAADTVKQQRRVVAVDPGGLVLENTVDARAQPDEEAQRHLDGEALRLVVESLDEREAAAIKLKFDCQLSAKEVQDVLGVGEKLLEARRMSVAAARNGTPARMSARQTGPATMSQTASIPTILGCSSPGCSGCTATGILSSSI
jgi:DNA-directed RNA polymerase specialized sigma24 family protein